MTETEFLTEHSHKDWELNNMIQFGDGIPPCPVSATTIADMQELDGQYYGYCKVCQVRIELEV